MPEPTVSVPVRLLDDLIHGYNHASGSMDAWVAKTDPAIAAADIASLELADLLKLAVVS